MFNRKLNKFIKVKLKLIKWTYLYLKLWYKDRKNKNIKH